MNFDTKEEKEVWKLKEKGILKPRKRNLNKERKSESGK